ncbi:MAG: zinc metalloprotease HtpX [Anaerovibrio sp.]|uniref:zinc metalloprotease HtpX n=1 Tax=Anaerovibrio sp. TaxID=1872532 RepID=UPI0025EA9620|nr:zinc metalloprotease HtpX [Anaerovibrio sp.]MCR5176067.1 zinc metalloprotease HtpX [Anaerovibrio sp.]
MNTIKTTVLMALLMGIMIAIGSAFGGRHGAMLMLIISLGMNFFTYWFSDTMVLKVYGAREVSQQEAPQLYGIVARLAANAQLPMPKVCIVNSAIPNAFATGRNPSHAAVAVTTGILNALSPDELSGVLAHELSHIKHRDTLISTVAAAIAGVISMLANIAQWSMIFGGRSDDSDNGGNIIGLLATIILAPLAAALIQMAISRSREYEADKSGGIICGNPNYLADALQKIEYYSLHAKPMEQATTATSHMFIINPLAGSKEKLTSLFSTHPATSERIALLRQQAREMGK